MGAGKRVDLLASCDDASRGRIGRHVDLVELRPGRLARQADIGNADRLAMAVGAGLVAVEMRLQRAQRLHDPVAAPCGADWLVELELMLEIFTHPRHQQRMRIAGDDLRQAARARPRGSDGNNRGCGCTSSRYSMMASDSKRAGPSPSTKAGIAIIGLTARNAGLRCSPFIKLTSMTSSGAMPLRFMAMRTR